MKKVALITGGTKGIGLGISQEFLNAGYSVVMNYRSDDSSAEKAQESLDSSDAITVKSDITQAIDRSNLIQQTLDHFGRIDVLINNAGIIQMGRTLDLDQDTYQKVIDCNLTAPIFLSQAFAKALVERKSPGAIVNISSMGAYGAGNLAYCTSKAALLAATRTMARELAKHKIRVNSISPGMVETELNQQARDEQPERWEKMLGKAAMKRAAKPTEIGSVAVFLASDAASYITGRDLVVDGGYLLN